MTEEMRSRLLGMMMARVSRGVFPQRGPAAWETLFEGAVDPEYWNSRANGYFTHIWHEDDGWRNVFSLGDVLRVTLDGEETTLSVEYYTTSNDDLAAGNKWLAFYTDSTWLVDNGLNFYFTFFESSLMGYFRSFEAQALKIERKSAISKPFVMDNPHLYNGFKFPVLPDRDTTEYPYAAILFSSGGYKLYCVFSKVPLEEGNESTTLNAEVLMYRYLGWLGRWDTEAVEGSANDLLYSDYGLLGQVLWSNYTFYWKDDGGAEVELEESKPVPVYE